MMKRQYLFISICLLINQLHPASSFSPVVRQWTRPITIGPMKEGLIPNHISPTKSLPLTLTLQASLIDSSDLWGNIAVLSATGSLSQNLGKITAIGRLLGPPVTAMAIAFCLGSIGILPPGGSPGAKILQLLCIQLATPLLLLGVDIRECRKSCGPLLIAFILAAFGTMLASTIAMPICSSQLQTALGSDGLKIAAALMAKNVGGGVNYVAVCRSLQASPNAIAAGLCVDNIFALLYFPITSAIATGRPDLVDDGGGMEDDKLETDKTSMRDMNINVETISSALTLAAIMTWMGEYIGGVSAALPISTFLTILFTTVFPKRAKSLQTTGDALGTSLLYLFFATAGAPGLSIADSVKSSFIPIGIFLTILYSVHGAFLLSTRSIMNLWKRKRMSWRKGKQGDDQHPIDEDKSALVPQRLLVASSASIGGPATAAALAQANKWESLVGPSLIVGNLGYAVATFAGIAFHSIFKM